eukprot:6485470-Amphidinium_carterae.1
MSLHNIHHAQCRQRCFASSIGAEEDSSSKRILLRCVLTCPLSYPFAINISNYLMYLWFDATSKAPCSKNKKQKH